MKMEKGQSWEIDSTDAQPWGWYKLPNGRELHLPADPFSIRKYTRKGWSLKPKDETKILKKEET